MARAAEAPRSAATCGSGGIPLGSVVSILEKARGGATWGRGRYREDRHRLTAVDAGALHTQMHVVAVDLDRQPGSSKGDALATEWVAGILAVKPTSDLIPLCHQFALTGVGVDFTVVDYGYRDHPGRCIAPTVQA